jgi:hypothetical protein
MRTFGRRGLGLAWAIAVGVLGAGVGSSASFAHGPSTTAEEYTRCFLVGVRSNYRNWNSTALDSSDQGFQWLNTNYSYTLALRGLMRKVYLADGRWYGAFAPSKFGVKGRSEGRSGGNPYGQALGGSVTFRLYSDKTSASYGLSIPWAFSIQWESSYTVRAITNRNWESTATTAPAGVMTWANPLVGVAGRNSGLYAVTVRTAVIPGGDSGAYNGPVGTWNLKYTYYSTYNSSPGFAGLTAINCSSITWSN